MLDANGSANRKHKYSAGGVRPVASHERGTQEFKPPGSFLENAHGTHGSPASSVKVLSLGVVPPSGTFSFRRTDRDTGPFFVPMRSSSAHALVF